MIEINLPDYLFQCEPAWRNMINTLLDNDTIEEVTVEMVQNELSQCGGLYNRRKRMLVFDTKENYEFWQLKWI